MDSNPKAEGRASTATQSPHVEDEDKMETTVTVKMCPRCGTQKLAPEFRKAKRKGGLRSYCKQCERDCQLASLSKLKEQVYNKLGQVCCRCGFSDKRALQIDHVKGGGRIERKEITNSYSFLKKVVADDAGAYQILCANCNWIKRAENKEHGFGPKISEEGIQRIVLASTNRIFSEEAIQKMRDSHKGQIPWSKGKFLSEEHKASLKAAAQAKTPEERSKIAKDRDAAMAPEKRSERAKKAAATKKRKNEGI